VPKFPTLGAAFAVAALFAAPAHAQFKIRAGAETQIVKHVNNPDSTTWLTDQWRPSLVGMVGFSLIPWLSLDAELAQTFIKNSSNLTTVRLGATLEPPVLPFYVRAAIPIQVSDPVFTSMRAGIGTTFGVPVAKIYLEFDADFPLSGNGHSFGDQQTFSLGGGLQLNL